MDPTLEQEIVSILNEANDLTIATVREDGYPQATTVSYINDGLTIYFGCAPTDMEELVVFRITPEIISVLDYRKGFGHTDLVGV